MRTGRFTIWVRGMEEKRQIRRRHILARDAMPKEEARRRSAAVCFALREFLEKEPALLAAGVYGYFPHGSEASLMELYQWMLCKGIPLAFPKVCGDAMEFYPVSSMDEFAEGAFRIMEPVNTDCPAAWGRAACLVPGSVFDRRGNRYGYGKGYYDRYFSRCPELIRIGVAFESQVEERILAEDFDVRMQAVVTERGVFCSGLKGPAVTGNL